VTLLHYIETTYLDLDDTAILITTKDPVWCGVVAERLLMIRTELLDLPSWSLLVVLVLVLVQVLLLALQRRRRRDHGRESRFSFLGASKHNEHACKHQ
jgi:hypothetical protein